MRLKIKGYTVFMVECSDSSYFCGMTDNLEKKLKLINRKKEPYFKKYPELLPVKVVFKEEHLLFREAYTKHTYLRSLTRRLRVKMAKTGEWPKKSPTIIKLIKNKI